MHPATLQAFADEMTKMAAAAAPTGLPKWVLPTAAHAGVGAAAGAAIDKDDRLGGAAKGAALGAAAGHAGQHVKRLHEAAKPIMKSKKIKTYGQLAFDTNKKTRKSVVDKAIKNYRAAPLYE